MSEEHQHIVSDEWFEQVVSDAITAIPEPYNERLGTINFQIAEQPTLEQRRKLKLRPYQALFGLYEGVPLPQRNGNVHAIVPDTITIFTHPMLHAFPDKESLRVQIHKTIWHEVAHFYGLNHDRIEELERQNRS